MLVLNFLLLLLMALGYLISRIGDKEWYKTLDRKEHPLYFLYPFSDFILGKTGLYHILFRKDKVREAIRALNVVTKPEVLQRLYWCSRVSAVILILVAFNLLSALGQLNALSNSVLNRGQYLNRPGYGEGSEEVNLDVKLDPIDKKRTKTGEDKKNYLKDIKIELEEKRYTRKQLKKAFDDAEKYLDDAILGKNKSPNEIYENLYFCSGIPGTSITVEWQPQDFNLIQSDGTVNNADLNKKGRITMVTALLSYQNQQREFKKSLRIMPRKQSREIVLQKELNKEVTLSSKKTITKDKLKLPDQLRGYHLSWKDKDQKLGVKLMIFGILTAVFVWIISEKDLEDKMKKRSVQMLLDYPDIINKFTLFINAGMTVKQAWGKISSDYEEKLMTGRMKRRFAYDEMLVTVHELQLGVTEGDAYERFGRRSGLLPFMKFSTLIAQNLKKGNAGLCEILNRESLDAFEERKEAAKRMGEEAGTKLLIPMMIMLIIVLIIIMVPALKSFNM